MVPWVERYNGFFSGLSDSCPCSAGSGWPPLSLRHHDLETRGIPNPPDSKSRCAPRCPHVPGQWGSVACLALEFSCPQWLPFSVGRVPGCWRTCGAISLLIPYCSILVSVLYINICYIAEKCMRYLRRLYKLCIRPLWKLTYAS
jgi:hypothetical protein